MPTTPDESISKARSRSGRAVGIMLTAATFFCGALSLAGWIIPAKVLIDWDGDGIVIKFNTALAITIAGLALLVHLTFPSQKVIVRALAVLAGVIGFATLIEHIFWIDLRIDQLILHDSGPQTVTVSPGRMGPPAATMLTLIGICTVLLTTGPRSRRIATGLALVVLTIASLSLTGYAFGADELYGIPRLSAIALETAALTALLAIGVIAAVPETGLMAALSRRDSGGSLFRRLLILMIVLPIILGRITIWGQEAGYYDLAFGTAIRTILGGGIFFAFLWWAASTASRADRQVRLISRMPEENPSPVLRLKPDGDVLYTNDAGRELVAHLAERPNGVVAETLKQAVNDAFSAGERREVELELDGGIYFVLLAPVMDEGHVNLYASDITERIAAETKAAAQANEQAVLYRLTDNVHRAESPEQVHEAALEAIIDGLVCDRASILLFDEAGVMSFVASRGLSDDYCKAVSGHSPWHPGDRSATPITIPDIRAAEITEELRSTIIRERIGALGFVPLNSSDGVVIGKFMVYYNGPHEFTDAELELAVTVGRQIAFGIERKRTEQALRDNEERLRLSTQTGKVGIWDWDVAANRITWTDSLYVMHGIGREDFDGTFEGRGRLIHPDDVDRMKAAVYAALDGDMPYEAEFRVVRPDGSIAWLYTNAVVTGHGDSRRMIGATVDITERKEAELASSRLAAIVQSSNDAVVSKDLNGIIQSWNKGAEALFGYTAEEAVGRSITMLIPPERINEEGEILAKIHRGEHIQHYETVRVTKDGRPLDISLTISPLRDAQGNIIGASKIGRDMTHRKRADAAIQGRVTLQRIVEAQEAERNRIARDLHDHLGQQLTGLRLKLESIKSLAAANPAVVDGIDQAAQQAHQIDTDMSLLAWELRPVSLDSHGLSDALASFVREWGQSHGIMAEFQCVSQNGRLASDVETNLYRIAQEALNNILKHAGAKEVSVTLNQNGREAVLVIEDDGRGFDPEKTGSHATGGLGLVGMRERATLLGGNLEIETREGGGTAIYARIPVTSVAPKKAAG